MCGFYLNIEPDRWQLAHNDLVAKTGRIFSTVLTLAVIPAIYALVKQWRLDRGLEG